MVYFEIINNSNLKSKTLWHSNFTDQNVFTRTDLVYKFTEHFVLEVKNGFVLNLVSRQDRVSADL